MQEDDRLVESGFMEILITVKPPKCVTFVTQVSVKKCLLGWLLHL